MKPSTSYSSTNYTSSAPPARVINDTAMQDTNVNLNLIGFLTQDGNIDNWRHFHQCLQPDGYNGQLKDSSYNEQANEFKYLIERDN